jgi:hypothetical protein
MLLLIAQVSALLGTVVMCASSVVLLQSLTHSRLLIFLLWCPEMPRCFPICAGVGAARHGRNVRQ